VTLLDQHAVAEALTIAGVDTDTGIGDLLAGYPTSYLRAEHTDTWVNRLYSQLQNSAPLAFWHRVSHLAARTPDGEPANSAVRSERAEPAAQTYGCSRAARRYAAPADDMEGSNSRLPQTLWERPAGLEATLPAESTT
jgi:hypothetical protein